ncbi:MAG: C10 family peptidase [Bacteroidales bacterium]|nr:C10 family peptidase [Bacteroidales bacterium]
MKSLINKATQRVLICLILSSSLLACTKLYQDSLNLVKKNETGTLAQNHVTISDIKMILERDFPKTKSSSDYQDEIIPYIDSNLDTMLYIVNFADNHGWKVFSSDKRTPAIIAEGDSGHFSLEEGNPAVKLWMSYTSNNIKHVAQSNDSSLSFSQNEIRSNQSFWTDVVTPMSNIDPPVIDFPSGHWEIDVTSYSEYYDTIDHMVPKWDQWEPYNEYCPYLTNYPTKKAPAGCVAIAGAQMLYFLHERLGTPVYMVDQGICIGGVEGYSREFSGMSSQVWAQMSPEYQNIHYQNLPEAIMIGHVGSMVNMHYCDNLFGVYSWALPINLKNNLFMYYNIECTYSEYDENTVKSSLLNQMPVIVCASDQAIPVNGNIHCFVIDGYRLSRNVTWYFHHYVLDRPATIPYPIEEPYSTYTYSEPYISEILINWGWWDQWNEQDPVNNGWYSLTAGWTVENNGTYDYNHNVNMITFQTN